MKKILSTILALVLIMGLAPSVLAVSGDEWDKDDVPYPVEGGNIYFDPATGTVTRSDEEVTSADIPEEINGVKVKRIGEYAFDLRLGLTSATVPSGVTEIADYAFEYCEALTSITLPNGLTRVGENAFRACSSLETLVLPDSVTYIGPDFLKGAGVKSFTTPKGVTVIKSGTFSYSNVVDVTFSDTVTTIESMVFSGVCPDLTSISIPSSVTSIEDEVFCADCPSLKDIYFDGTEEEWTALVGDGQRIFEEDRIDLSQITFHFNGKESLPSDEQPGESPATPAFTDVPEWCAEAAEYMAENNLMNGTGAGKFSPNVTTTRGMLMTILARADGVDTAGDPWYKAGMEWCVGAEVSDGLRPEATVTRQEIATMLWRYFDKPACDKTPDFPDVDSVESYAVTAVNWCVDNGIINGNNGLLDPKGPATRAQAATMVYRALTKFAS